MFVYLCLGKLWIVKCDLEIIIILFMFCGVNLWNVILCILVFDFRVVFINVFLIKFMLFSLLKLYFYSLEIMWCFIVFIVMDFF